MKIRLLGVLVLVLWLSSPALGDLGRGLTAYNQGDYASALKEWRPVAEQGDAKAQAMLGHMYSKGQGVAQNDAEAVRWYRAAAEQGHGTAQFNLGNALREGRGVPQNNTEAVRWYRAAAEQGHVDAQTSLGIMHLEGQGVPQSDAEAMRLTRAAAEQGHVDAQSNLGLMYAGGRGAPENLVLAYKWMSLSAAQGGEVARENVGILEKHYMTPAQIAEAKRLVAEAQGQTQESRGQTQESTGVAQSAPCQNNLPPSHPDSVYIDHGDGTVTDTRTGLMWKQCTEGLSGVTCETGSVQGFNHAEALAQAEASTFANYSDWRLPDADELQSLVEKCRVSPSINTNLFPNTPSTNGSFWSSSRVGTDLKNALALHFGVSGMRISLGGGNRGGSTIHARLVRGGSQESKGQTQESTGVAQSAPCQNNLPPSNPDSVYIDHGDGTVTDTRTGLMWKQCAEGLSGATCQTGSAHTLSWHYARANLEDSTFANYSDWRLPNEAELQSLVEKCRVNPSINTSLFPNTPSLGFWSVSFKLVGTRIDTARLVNFRDGVAWSSNTSGGSQVRLVRGGSQESKGQTQESTGVAQSAPCQNNLPPSHPDSVYIDHGDGTVTDTRTGLMWKRCAEGMSWTGAGCTGSANIGTWHGALKHADSVSGWRLPNIGELRSIVEQCAWTTRSPTAMNQHVFPGTPPLRFWSASPVAELAGHVWNVNFSNGNSNWNIQSSNYGVRLVSGGQ